MNEVIKKFNEGVISELCKVLAIRYKYADGEAMTWITKNILSFTKEIDGHQYGLKIVQLDRELPNCGHAQMTAARYSQDVTCPLIEAGFRYRVID